MPALDNYLSVLQCNGYVETCKPKNELRILEFKQLDLGNNGKVVRIKDLQGEYWDAVFDKSGEEVGMYPCPFSDNLLARRKIDFGVSREKVA